MLDKELEQTLNQAFREARGNNHEFMTVEHLLLALLDNNISREILLACGANISGLKTELNTFLQETVPLLPPNDDRDTQPTLGFQRVLQRAVFHVQSSGKQEVSAANVLVAIFSEQESQAVFFLKKQDINRLEVVNYLSHGISRLSSDEDMDEEIELGDDEKEAATKNPLTEYTTNLNELAEAGKIDPLIGRADEIERTIQVLCRRRKNNPLFVGEAGVGKTALAEGLAKRIVDKEVPDIIKDAVIYSLDLGALLAGTKYRGDFEKRFKAVMSQLKKEDDAILFIDEIHTIIGAGAASGGAMDASNLIKPVLSNGELKCIGSTTYQEYRGIFEKDRALARRFQKIDVPEPTVEECIQILQGLKSRCEQHHNVKYTQPALRGAAELAERYINDRHLPDKAIDVIDEAGAFQQLQSASKRKKTIGIKEIEAIVAKIARIPPKTVSNDDMDTLKNLERNLKLVIFGQDEAIDSLATAIKLSRAGLGNEDKPVGSFLFAGPTGVGKTEVTRQLARIMGIELIRFDMSEYMERHTVSRLIGAPPGYVGFDQGGLLTEEINKHPHAVLLLDEIEKAHPDVFNVLLQFLDDGRLTDWHGRTVGFKNTVIIMTSNAGAELLSRSSMGFAEQDHSSDGMESIKKAFSPEFRNRLDGIIQFKQLGQDMIAQVVDKFIFEFEHQLEEKGVTLSLDDEVRTWLAIKGYDPVMGARPMTRVIQEHLKKPLAEDLLFGNLAKGGHVTVTVKKDELVFDVQSKNLPAKLNA